jgi:prepilin peptidase CpaA
VIATLADVGLTSLLVVAAWFDVRFHRIPNQLTLVGLVVALLLRAPLGWDSWLRGIEGLAVALLAGLLFYVLGAFGGGDAKLLGAVGAFVGPTELLGTLAYIVLAGALAAIVVMARRGLLPLLLINTLQLFKSLRFAGRAGGVNTLETPGSQAIPYAVPIAVGTLIWWFGQGVRL